MKSSFDLVLDGLKDLVEQKRAHEVGFKQPQNGTILSSKPTPRSKRNKEQNVRKGTIRKKGRKPGNNYFPGSIVSSMP